MTTQLFKFAALAQAAVALIFILIALTAGHKANYMENIHIIRFNMSEIGQNLIPDPSAAKAPVPEAKDCGPLGALCGVAGDAIDKVQGAAGDAIDKVSEFSKDKLNIKDYYSIHLTDLCLGDFDADGDPKIDSCTTPFKKDDINVLKQLTDQVKSVGIDLEKLGFVKELNDAFDKIPKVLATTGYFFTAIAVLLALCLATTAGAAFIASELGNTLSLAAIGLAGLTWLLVLIAVLIITVAAVSISNKVNEEGNKIGIYSSVGGILMFLIWTGLILITGVLGTLVLCLAKKEGPPPRAEDDGQMYATKEMDSQSMDNSSSGEFNREHVYGHQEGAYEGGYEGQHHEGSDAGEAAGYYHPEDHHHQGMHSHPDDMEALSPINEEEAAYPPGPYQHAEPSPLSAHPPQGDMRYSVGPGAQGQQYHRYSVSMNDR